MANEEPIEVDETLPPGRLRVPDLLGRSGRARTVGAALGHVQQLLLNLEVEMVANGLTDDDVVPDSGSPEGVVDGVTYGARRDELATRRDRLAWKYVDLLPEIRSQYGGSD